MHCGADLLVFDGGQGGGSPKKYSFVISRSTNCNKVHFRPLSWVDTDIQGFY